MFMRRHVVGREIFRKTNDVGTRRMRALYTAAGGDLNDGDQQLLQGMQ